MKNEFYQSPKSSYLMRLFWRAAGADRYLLERSTYSDQIKYFCLGGIVVATGVMAALAGGYAFYYIFSPKGPATETAIDMQSVLFATFFGIVWGLIIFNIDRFIVTSTGKGDGTEAITGREFKSAIPRIIMGMIIALTISKPIEIKMFETEINHALFEKQEDIKRDSKKEINSKYKEDFAELNEEIVVLKNEILEAKTTFQKYDNIATEEWEGKSGTGESGDGPAYRMKKATAENYKAIWSTTDENNTISINDIKNEKQDLKILQDEELGNASSKANMLDGLLERLKLAHQIAGFWISLFITLLFMVIELTPIFFKMMLIKGPYDYFDENVKELARAENGIEIQYDFYQGKDGMEKHKVINHNSNKLLKEKIAMIKAQQEMNLRVIEKWKDKELGNIDENP